ncbi:hypothetical protein [Terrabacter sp. MAHUQ-38]|uniref:hypothetical protein n=1 Tax=unclassified Terrabacter TaxID=2630222 RepID=UPI00165E8518|nr:hypothetical protein [Terrabacter sp. MAHUQ-38]MBC9822620.1 hypothetical protein [Terrabacter sp. MAHUQ-38]
MTGVGSWDSKLAVAGHRPRSFPMPVRLFERIAGKDLTTTWRWLRTAQLDISTRTLHRILSLRLCRTCLSRPQMGHGRTDQTF